MIKICQRCGADFDAKSNRTLRCPSCRVLHKKEYNRQHYLQNQDTFKARSRQQYIEHRDDLLAYFKKYHLEHREQRLQYFAQRHIDNPDYHKQWAANNSVKVRAYRRRWRYKKRVAKLHARLEFKKARLRDILKANAEKRQEKQREHDKLYHTTSDWDKYLQFSPLLSRLI